MIAAVALDTNAYSGFRKGDADLVEVVSRVPRLMLPLVVLAELLAGFAGGRKSVHNRTELAMFMASPRVSILPPDRETAEVYARVFQQLRTDARPIPTNDIWIAAACIQHQLPLVSLDSYFAHVAGLRSARGLTELLGREP